MSEAMKAAFDLAYETVGEDAWHDTGCDKIFAMGWQAALSQQPAQPVRIEFGKGLVGVHTIMNEGRTGIALTNLGTGVIGAPTLHENGTPCDQNLVEMDFANSESCQVLIDELSGLFQALPTEHIMGLLGAACYVIRKYEPESNLLQKIRDVTFDRKPALPSCADLKIKSQVIRYSLDEGGKGINFDEFGNYVHICDYEGLIAENERLKEELRPMLLDSVVRSLAMARDKMWMPYSESILLSPSKITAARNKAKKQRRKAK